MAQRPWVFYGWIVVACTVLVTALTSGARMSFGVALIPISEQFGWTRTTLSTIVLMSGIVSGVLQMVVGVLVDRIGPKRLMASGVILLGLGVWLLTFATTVWQFGLAYGVLVGVGLVATQNVVISTLVANWFVQSRGLAQSMVNSAIAVGWMVIVPLNMFIERAYDWTTMYRVIGTALLVGTLPLVWACIRNRPEDMGLRPYGAEAVNQTSTPTGDGTSAGALLRQAIGHARTWKLLYLGFA